MSFVSDGTSAVLVTLVLFAWPRNLPFQNGELKSGPPILTWEAVEKRLCWGVVFLLGGGFAIGTAVQKTGLSALLGMLTIHDLHQAISAFEKWTVT